MEDALRILCVDDEPGLAELVGAYLERDEQREYDPVVETDPAVALARIHSEPFDCVVSDYNMPGRTGIELVREARETHPELPFLLFSSEDPNQIAAEMVHAGVNDYVTKRGGTEAYTLLIRRVEHAASAPDGRFAHGAIDDGGTVDDDPTPNDQPSKNEDQANKPSHVEPPAEPNVTLDGVCTVGPDGTFEYVCEGYGELYGYTPDELVGEPWQRLHPDEEVEHIRTHVLPVVDDGGRWTGHSEGLRADGTTFTESKMVRSTPDDRLLIAVSEYGDADA